MQQDSQANIRHAYYDFYVPCSISRSIATEKKISNYNNNIIVILSGMQISTDSYNFTMSSYLKLLMT